MLHTLRVNRGDRRQNSQPLCRSSLLRHCSENDQAEDLIIATMHASIKIQEFCTGRADYARAVHSLPQISTPETKTATDWRLGPAPQNRTDRRGQDRDRAPIGDMAVQHGEQDLVVDAGVASPGRCPGLVGCGPFGATSQTAHHRKERGRSLSAPGRPGLAIPRRSRRRPGIAAPHRSDRPRPVTTPEALGGARPIASAHPRRHRWENR